MSTPDRMQSPWRNLGTATGRRLLLVGALLVVAIVGWFVGLNHLTGSRTTLSAIFVDASPLEAGNEVRLDGLKVGTISSITLLHGKARVEISLDRSVLPLHADATARVEPVSLLGERFIALNRGTPPAPIMGDPLVIPVTQTGSAVDLDQVLNTLDDPTSTALAAMVTTLGEGVAGQGGTAARAFQQLAPTFQQADQLSTLLDQQNAVLEDLVVQAQKNATAAARPMDSLVAAGQQTLGAVAANRQAMNDALVELPLTLNSAQRTLGQLAGTADNTTAVLLGTRPLTDHLVQVSEELTEFADAAKPALSSLPDVLRRVDHMLDEARPVVRALRPAAHNLNSIGASANTLSAQLFTHAPGVASQLENLLTGAAEWSMATSGYDGLSHYFRAVVAVNPSSLATAGLGLLPPITPRNALNPLQSDPNGPSERSSRPLPPVPAMPNMVGPDEPGHPSSTERGDMGARRDNASGLSPQQESDMFGQLLGGGN